MNHTTQQTVINSTHSTNTQPLLLINDVQRRRRIKQTKHHTQQEMTKTYIKNNELIMKPSQKYTEEHATNLYANTHVSKYKSKSQSITQNRKLLKPQTNKYRNHSKSGPPKLRKKRTFKLSEPKEIIIREKRKLRKKPSRNFLQEINSNNNNNNSKKNDRAALNKSKSLNNVCSIQHTKPIKSLPTFSFGVQNHSFSSYQSQFNVHKPKIKPGSNQFLDAQQKQLQLKLKTEEEQKNNDNDMNMNKISEQNFGKSLNEIKTIKLPNYTAEIPLILIELKKRLNLCDGLKQRKIFHISVKNNTATHHQITALMRNFFINLPSDNRLLDHIFIDIMIYVQRLTHYKQMEEIMLLISDPNKSILLWLWDILSDTIEYSMYNKMNIESLSKSMAPYMCTNVNYRLALISFFKYGIQWRLYSREYHN